MTTADEWMAVTAEHSSITVEELDRRAKEYHEAYAEYEKAKSVSTELFKKAEVLEGKLIEAMELAGKNKYHVEGIGTFSFVNKMTVPTPKTPEERRALFGYIRDKHGDDFFHSVASVNHQTLQKLYNTDFEEYVETNPEEAASFAIPGLQAPTNKKSLAVRGEKK